MKSKKLEVQELSLKEKIETDGGFMVPISWIIGAAVAANELVEGAKAAFKTLTSQ